MKVSHLIDGERREPSGGRWVEVTDPATGAPVTIAAVASPQDVADRVAAAFAEPLCLADGTGHAAGISVGVALCDATDTPASALSRADAAMYRVEATHRAALSRT